MQPLAVDWREKLKANRKSSSKGGSGRRSPDSASPSRSPQPGSEADVSVSGDGKPNLEVLSKGLPAGWRAMWDKNTGDIYYGNVKTRVRAAKKGGSSFELHITVGAWRSGRSLFGSCHHHLVPHTWDLFCDK